MVEKVNWRKESFEIKGGIQSELGWEAVDMWNIKLADCLRSTYLSN